MEPYYDKKQRTLYNVSWKITVLFKIPVQVIFEANKEVMKVAGVRKHGLTCNTVLSFVLKLTSRGAAIAAWDYLNKMRKPVSEKTKAYVEQL